MGVCVVSYALFGSEPKYTIGAIKNALQVPEFYPDWQCWIGYGQDVPRDVLLELAKMPHVRLWTSALGKFARVAMWDNPEIDAILGRDADSRLSECERVTVEQWLASGVRAYCAHDCKAHSRPLMNGLLGVRRPAEIFPDMANLISIWRSDPEAVSDDAFASAVLYPRLARDMIVYYSPACDYFRSLFGPQVVPLPGGDRGPGGFLGAICSPDV